MPEILIVAILYMIFSITQKQVVEVSSEINSVIPKREAALCTHFIVQYNSDSLSLIDLGVYFK